MTDPTSERQGGEGLGAVYECIGLVSPHTVKGFPVPGPLYTGSRLVVIWSGEHQAYWRPRAAGYTTGLAAAGVFTLAEARRRAEHAGPEKRLEYRDLAQELDEHYADGNVLGYLSIWRQMPYGPRHVHGPFPPSMWGEQRVERELDGHQLVRRPDDQRHHPHPRMRVCRHCGCTQRFLVHMKGTGRRVPCVHVAPPEEAAP